MIGFELPTISKYPGNILIMIKNDVENQTHIYQISRLNEEISLNVETLPPPPCYQMAACGQYGIKTTIGR